jgi:peptide deformylase
LYRKVLSVIEHPRELRRVSSSLPSFAAWTQEDRAAINDLTETFAVLQGYGLAAPQIGALKRVICINPKLLSISDDLESLVMINPTLEVFGEPQRNREACFSIPEVDGFVERLDACIVEYVDVHGKKQKLTATGYAAVCIQHEVDHLDGILYIDRAGQISRSMILKRAKKICKKKAKLREEAKRAFDEEHASLDGGITKKTKTGHSKKRKPKARKRRLKKSKKG